MKLGGEIPLKDGWQEMLPCVLDVFEGKFNKTLVVSYSLSAKAVLGNYTVFSFLPFLSFAQAIRQQILLLWLF